MFPSAAFESSDCEASVAVGVLLDEERGEGENILRSLTERGNGELNDVEPEKEVVSKGAPFDTFKEVGCGGDDQTGAMGPDPSRFRGGAIGTERFKQFGLACRGKFADLLDEQSG